MANPSGLYPSFHMWTSMFTLNWHLLCPRTISQLSLNSSSSSDMLHPLCNEICCTGISSQTKLLLSEREPQPPRLHRQHYVWGNCLRRQASGIWAICSCHTNKGAGYLCYPRCPNTERQSDSCAIKKKQLSRLIFFQKQPKQSIRAKP